MDLYSILTTDNVVDSINDNLDYLLELIPEIKPMIGCDHKHPHHHLDVWNHTLLALSLSPNNFEIRLILLLHDIGKTSSWYEKDGVRHFDNHPSVSAKIAYDILKRLNYKDDFVNRICFFVEKHDSPMTSLFIDSNYDDALLLYEVQKCDALAHHPDKLEKRKQYLEKVLNKINGR